MNSISDAKVLSLNFIGQAFNQLPKITMAIALFIAFTIAAKIIAWTFKKSIKHLHWDKSVKTLLTKAIQTSIVLLGLVTALGTAGVNVSALVASLGLLSFTVGFAFKDLLTNTLAGVLILIYRPFRVGDAISGSNFDGIVKDINLRYVQLQKDNDHVLVPNATILTSVVNVHTKKPA